MQGLDIYISPKIPVLNVFQMIGAIGGFEKINDTIVEFKDFGGICEMLAYVFNQTLYHALLRNKRKGYILVEDNLKYVRGRILVPDNVRKNQATPYRMYCRYDEFSSDIFLNRVLKAALSRLKFLNLSKTTRHLLHANLVILQDVSDIEVTLQDIEKISFNRLDKEYEFLIFLAHLILSSTSVTHKHGEYSFSSFLINMNSLFEHYVKKVLSNSLPADVFYYGKGKSHYLDEGQKVSLEPDIIFEKQGERIIVDTKYKISDMAKASNSDIYQIFAYCHAYMAKTAVLLYPKAEDIEEGEYVVINNGPNVLVRKISLMQNYREACIWGKEFIIQCFDIAKCTVDT